MNRDEFNNQLQALIESAYEDKLSIMNVWGVLSEHIKVAELMLDFEILSKYKNAIKEESDKSTEST